MTTRFFGIAAVALAAALSACAASASSPRLASTQAQLHIATAPSSPHCGYDQGGFNTPDAVKLPKDAFCSPE